MQSFAANVRIKQVPHVAACMVVKDSMKVAEYGM